MQRFDDCWLKFFLKEGLDAEHGEERPLEMTKSGRQIVYHNNIVLNPTPSSDPNDPLNWSWLKKHYTLAIVCYLSFLQGFAVTVIISSYGLIATAFHTTPYRASFFVAAVTITHSVGPILFVPFSAYIGRRWLYIIMTTIMFVSTIGCAYAPDYNSFMAARIFQGFGSSLGWGLPPAIVADLFFYHQRGQKMGFFILSSYMGIIIGPLSGGFAALHGFRYGIWITAIMTGIPLVLLIFTYPETLYIGRKNYGPVDESLRRPWSISGYYNQMRPKLMPKESRMDSLPSLVLRPFKMLKYPSVYLAGLYFGFNFMWKVSIGTTLPLFFTPIYDFTPQQTGLVYLGFLVGAILGEQMAGPFSDYIIRRMMARNGGHEEPEMRLRAIYLGAFLSPAGLLIFGVTLSYKTNFYIPVVALGIYTFGLEIIGTVCTTYAVDSYRQQSPEVGALFSVFRNMVRDII